MPDIPDVSAIVKQVKARIKQIEDQLGQHEKLTDELGRLREALRRLEGEARSRVSAARRRRTPATDRAAGAAKPAGTRTRAPRGQNKARVLEALKDGPMTASEIAEVTGIATGTVSTLLSRMAKSGELAKAERGYTLPQ
jgi:DNA-binding IclR family transcriptional regulator